MHEEIKKHWNYMNSKEKKRFSVNTPVSEKEKNTAFVEQLIAKVTTHHQWRHTMPVMNRTR